MARQKLTEEEKAAKLASKKERLQLQLAKIKSTEKREERKKRAKELGLSDEEYCRQIFTINSEEHYI